MFGLSLTEILVVMVLGLVILGPEKIPDVARTIGKAIREVRKASNLLRDALMIDEPAPRAKPVARPATPANSPTPSNDYTPPAPKHTAQPGADVAFVRMARPSRRPDVRVVGLTSAAEHEALRDVYLHVPYHETLG